MADTKPEVSENNTTCEPNGDNSNDKSSTDTNDGATKRTAGEIGTSESQQPPKKKSKSRCYVDDCKQKVMLFGFSCRCVDDYKFCGKHRLPESHGCSYDYKTEARERLEASMPKVEAPKVNMI